MTSLPLLLLLLAAGAPQGEAATSPAVTAADLAARMRVLASDEFEGRGPATAGEEQTVTYLAAEFARAGLRPGNGGSWFQEVPLVATTPTGKPSAALARDGRSRELVFGRDLMFVSPVPEGPVEVDDSAVVFAGYGIVAPEYGWDDYAGLDVAGKTVVVLVNDPGYATGDPALFRGRAMTYYGRYTYKYEEAARQGAAACLVVHEEGPAGYPWQVVMRSWGGTRYGLDVASDEPRLAVEGWITDAAAAELAAEAGRDWGALKERARARGARPVELGTTATLALANASTRSRSRNVVGLVPGRERPEEVVLFCAHWDHLGRRPGVGDDDIYNGAEDNASGSAGLVELAEAFGALDPPPARSVLFLAVTAEESGLLGSKYYAANPLRPLAATVAGVNMDGLNVLGPMADVVVIGYGASELDELLAQAAAAQGRTLSPEATPEKGYYYRSDHFSLAKQGVPMLYAGGGTTSRAHGREWVAERDAEYLRLRYHQPSDEFDERWDLAGAVEDLRLYLSLGLRLANGRDWPNWVGDSEFRAVRDASRASAR